MPKPIHGDKVLLKSEQELVSILNRLGWNSNQKNRDEIAKQYGNKVVTIQNPQDHHDYAFSKEGPTIHYSMIKAFK